MGAGLVGTGVAVGGRGVAVGAGVGWAHAAITRAKATMNIKRWGCFMMIFLSRNCSARTATLDFDSNRRRFYHRWRDEKNDNVSFTGVCGFRVEVGTAPIGQILQIANKSARSDSGITRCA